MTSPDHSSPQVAHPAQTEALVDATQDRKSTRLNSSHLVISYAVFCLKKKKQDATAHGGCVGTEVTDPIRQGPVRSGCDSGRERVSGEVIQRAVARLCEASDLQTGDLC